MAKPSPSKYMSVKKGHGGLTLWICVAIVMAILMALFLPEFAMRLHIGGELFLRLLKMVVVPLVMTSVLCGILCMGDVRKLGRPGAAAIGYYLCTTVVERKGKAVKDYRSPKARPAWSPG